MSLALVEWKRFNFTKAMRIYFVIIVPLLTLIGAFAPEHRPGVKSIMLFLGAVLTVNAIQYFGYLNVPKKHIIKIRVAAWICAFMVLPMIIR